MTEGLRRERRGRTETWTLNRPLRRNALDPELVEALHGALDAAEADDVEVVVLRGAGRSFCAGADLTYLRTHDPAQGRTPVDFLRRIWDLTLRMERSPVVLVAVLHGHAVAGGLELALACDVVVAAEGTRIGDGHVRRNLLPGGGASVRLERALGPGPAAWLALSGALPAADDPAFRGWLHRVVPADELEACLHRVVDQLLAGSPPARRRYKALLATGPDEADRDRELAAFTHHWLTQDVPGELRQFLTRNTGATR